MCLCEKWLMLLGNSVIHFPAFFSLGWVWSLLQHCSTGAESSLVSLPASTLPACTYFISFNILTSWWSCSIGQLRGTPRKVSKRLSGNGTPGDTGAGLNRSQSSKRYFTKSASLPWILSEIEKAGSSRYVGLQCTLCIRNQIPKYF